MKSVSDKSRLSYKPGEFRDLTVGRYFAPGDLRDAFPDDLIRRRLVAAHDSNIRRMPARTNVHSFIKLTLGEKWQPYQ